jgi:dihydropteroate synthase
MKIVRLSKSIDKKRALESIDTSKEGAKIMQEKMELEFFYIKELKTPAANILKQDALSIGAELAVQKDTILCKDKSVDAILIVNKRDLRTLVKKEKAQPFGLKALSFELEKFIKLKEFEPKIMGVLNANDDSFYEKSRFDVSSAIEKIVKMIEDGADIIDIGGVSSRPGSKEVSEEEELERIKDIVDLIYKERLYERVDFSLDSYAPKPIEYALERGFHIINDITGLESDEVCRLASIYQAKVVIMHKKGKPADMQKNPHYDDVIVELDEFFRERIQKAKRFGLDDIVLDVGIGFGKRLRDNLLLIKHLGHFQHFGYELLVGASRKSMIDSIMPTDVKDRLPATLALHLKALEEGASILRVHDVIEHKRAISIYQAFKGVVL